MSVRLRAVSRVVVLALVAASMLVPAGRPAHSGTGRYVVVLHATANPVRVAMAHKRDLHLQPAFVYRHALRGYTALVRGDRLDSLRADPRVAAVVADVEVRTFSDLVPTGVRRIGAVPPDPSAGSGVHVAILDTGIDHRHPDLAGKVAGSTNCALGIGVQDLNGHGTHVAGIVAAGADGSGVVGVAPGASVWNVKVLNALGTGSLSHILCGLDYVARRAPGTGGPIRVVNMSLGFTGARTGSCSTATHPMEMAVCRLVALGVTVVAAAGNDGEDMRNSAPASYDAVIAVTALADSDGMPCGRGQPTSRGPDDTFAAFSNFPVLASDVARTVGAPGVGILSAAPFGRFQSLSGTSQAAPHVAGLAARYIASNPSATPADVLAALRAGGELPDQDARMECGGDPAHIGVPRHPEPVVRADML